MAQLNGHGRLKKKRQRGKKPEFTGDWLHEEQRRRNAEIIARQARMRADTPQNQPDRNPRQGLAEIMAVLARHRP